MATDAGRYVYFLYSAEQRKLREQIENNIGKTYYPGKVLSNGRWKEYTEMNSTGTSRYSDAIIVEEGNLNLFKKTPPKSM